MRIRNLFSKFIERYYEPHYRNHYVYIPYLEAHTSMKTSGVDKDFSLFDPKFLEEISKDERAQHCGRDFEKNAYRAMKAYLNGILTNEEVIAELMQIAKDMTNAQVEGDAMGLLLML